MIHVKRICKLFLVLLVFQSCSKSENAAALPDERTLEQTIESRFPFTPNQNFEALYLGLRRDSGREWYFNFHIDGSLDVLFTTDTNDNFSFPGSYTYANDQITIQMPAGDNMPFPFGLNETSRVIMPQFGLVAAFATDEMVAVCVGHGYNTQQPPRINASYGCPEVAGEENVIELVHSAVPFSFPVEGSIFRQRELRSVLGTIIRGYGIYRQTGNEFYASFKIAEDFLEFAQGQLPFPPGSISAPFQDFNILSGRLENNGQVLIVDQLEQEQRMCELR